MSTTLSAELIQQMREWRHDIHQYPELAYQEQRTSEKVAQQLKQLGLAVYTSIGGTGVVGILQGKRTGARHIALRADMDALPVAEANTFDYKSRHEGKMHACGHDGHTAILLGAATALAIHPDFAGTVYFIFQPAEEGQAGARSMMEDGLFTRFPIQEIYGLHNWPGLGVGKIAIHSAAVMAGTDSFDITVTGNGGHAAMPDTTHDPILMASHLVTAIQSIVARNTRPVDSGVVSVTHFQAGTGAYNVIPEQVQLRGTMRSLNDKQRQLLRQRLQQLVEHIPQAFGGSAELKLSPGYPPTINHAAQAEACRLVANALVGETNVHWNPEPSMGAEDFAYFLQEKPGAYFWLGNGELSKGGCHGHPLHSAYYDFNDDLLGLGAQFWINLVKHLCL